MFPSEEDDHPAGPLGSLTRDATLLAALVAAVPTGLVAVDDAGFIVCVNPAFLSWASRPALPDPTGRGFAEAFPSLVRPVSGGFSEASPELCWVRGPEQGWIGHVQAGSGALQDPLPDELTGLGGRSELALAFGALVVSGAVARQEAVYLALDLDGFKEVNDTYGHPVGDELLRRVARRIGHVVGSFGTVFRLGGDEFSVLLSCPGVEGVTSSLAKRLVDVLGRSFVIQGQEVRTGASIGIARVSPSALSIDAPYQEADIALYASKHSGRGQAILFEPQVARVLEEQRLIERDLRRSILLDQLELHYQPERDLQAGAISGFQAQVRWRHPERGMIAPAAFIPVAEKTRFIAEIGRWVLREACRTAATWPSPQSVTVSVSPSQFTDTRFLAMVFRALQESGLEPGRLVLEVTKSIPLVDQEHVKAAMAVLQEAGVKASLDEPAIPHPLPS